ncbi:MAG TPA: SdiA-regulated domain-containing protein [Chitinophagaceae bacterium]|nr:SdiA-regulated domain-containing protein [Chitinophagaceae bacterium]
MLPLMLLVVCGVADAGCRQKKKLYQSPDGYDFATKMEITKLDLKLREISGISWDSDRNVFVSINDERGKLFLLGRETKAIQGEYDFGGRGDYEDVAIVDGVPYILESDGTLHKFHIDTVSKSGQTTTVGKVPIEGNRDFETLYYDRGRRALILLCKNCDVDDRKKVSAFAYYPDSIGFDPRPVYQIDVAEVSKLAPEKSSRIEPSAAAIHPLYQKLYILSSASNQLVITDLNGKAEKVFVLIPSIFTQPEGICFKKNGDMYISNEGGTGKATLIRCAFETNVRQ